MTDANDAFERGFQAGQRAMRAACIEQANKTVEAWRDAPISDDVTYAAVAASVVVGLTYLPVYPAPSMREGIELR